MAVLKYLKEQIVIEQRKVKLKQLTTLNAL